MPISTAERFWAKVNKLDDCWLWTAGCYLSGYGQFRIDGRQTTAHRAAWELEYGSIPDGMQVNHHCDNPPCVRPEHLFLGTQKDNIDDMCMKGRHPNSNKSHCKYGHAYDKDNTYQYGTKRECRACRQEYSRLRWIAENSSSRS